MQGLEKARQRKQLGLTVVEGAKEIEMALEGGMQFESYYYVPGIADLSLLDKLFSRYPQCPHYTLSEDVFAKLSYRESTGGVIAVVKTKPFTINALKPGPVPLVLVIEGVEKPGNLGAMLRTADACAIDAVIVCDLPGDVFNPNVIRASLGTVFTVPIAVCSSDEAMRWLKENNIKTYCSNLHQANDYFKESYKEPSAIVVGTEATGITDKWIQFADKNVKIPMLGKIDSMNVSVAAAIMLYEAKRQRFK